MRIVIAGGPGAGKSTLARDLARAHALPLRSTDELIALPWEMQSERVAEWLLTRPQDAPGPVRVYGDIIEGARAVSGLRKALQRTAKELPIDKVIFMHDLRRELAPQARELRKRVTEEWIGTVRPELQRRGVEVEDRGLTGSAWR